MPDVGELKLSPGDWRILDQVHSGLGHCPNSTLVRVLKYGKARPILIKAAGLWRCAACERRKLPKKPRPAQAPITYEINDVVGLDIVFVRNHLGVKVPCLNMVDWGSLAQIVVPLPDHFSPSIRTAYRRFWKRFFGCPRMLVIDQELGFSKGEFPQLAQAEGTEVVVTSSRSPWQAGRTERAGGTWKEVFYKVCEERPLATQEDFEEAIDATTVACNEAVRSSGYSVYSRLFGRGFRLPEGAAGDVEPVSLEAASAMGIEAEVTRGVYFRQLARKAFIEIDARRRWQRAFHRRSPTPSEP